MVWCGAYLAIQPRKLYHGLSSLVLDAVRTQNFTKAPAVDLLVCQELAPMLNNNISIYHDVRSSRSAVCKSYKVPPRKDPSI